MIFKRPKSAVSNQSGFTLVELMMVVGILGVLASIALMAFTANREKGYDAQVISIMKTLLTVSAVDEPIGVPGDSIGPGAVGGNLTILGYPELQIAKNMHYFIENDGADRWLFWFAHTAGANGYYFWVPGEDCAVEVDAAGNPSDRIFWDNSVGSHRNSADPVFP